MRSRIDLRIFPRAWQAVLCVSVVLSLAVLTVRGQLSGVREGRQWEPGAIEGELCVAAGSPRSIAEVTVTVLKTGATARVDARGRFAFENLPPDTYTLVARGDGFSLLVVTDVVVRPAELRRLSTQEMPVLLQEGEVHRMEPVIVSATKEAAALERLEISARWRRPFATANVDLPRTSDDAQPYYVFDRSTIARSGAATLEDFVRSRVPMDATRLRLKEFVRPGGFGLGTADNRSEINLNGLGAEQTLILVNGRRLPNVSFGGTQNTSYQPNVNGVPLGAIDRIELLPASASAIYGSGAMGGVVNIVLRDDFDGAELTLGYENPIHGHAPIRRAALSAGEALADGRTHVMVALSYTESRPLTFGDREALLTGLRDRAWRNDPAAAGAPAYTSPPIGTTPNVTAAPVTRVVDGKVVSVPGELFGPGSSDHAFVPVGYAGGGGIEPFQAGAGSYNLVAPDSGVGERGYYGRLFPLELDAKISSAYASLRHRLQPGVELEAEFFHAENRSQNPSEPGAVTASLPANVATNPFGVPVRVSAQMTAGVDTARQVVVEDRVALGMKVDLARDWRGEAEYVYSGTNVRSTNGMFVTSVLATEAAAGRIDLLRDLQKYPIALDSYRGAIARVDPSSLHALDFRAAGPSGSAPGGAIASAFGVGAMRESLGDSVQESVVALPAPAGSRTVTVTPGLSRWNTHAYAELEVPLVAERNAKPGVARFDLQLAGRLDHFAVDRLDSGKSGPRYFAASPIAGVQYRPVSDLMLRGSYSLAFQPPDFAEFLPWEPLLPVSQSSPTGWIPLALRDPRRGGELTTGATGSLGGNPAVRPTTSRSTHIGVVLEPRILRGLRVSVDYVWVERTDEIRQMTWDQVVANEALLPGRVVRAAAEAGDGYGVGRITFVDGRMLNIASSRSVNCNVAIDYAWGSERSGYWDLFAIGNSWQHFQRRLVPGAELEEQINGDVSSLQQPKFTATAGLDWSRGRWSAGWTMRFVGSYRVSSQYMLAQGSGWVPSQVFHDVYLGYTLPRLGRSRGWWQQAGSGLSIQAGAKNVLQAAPAFEAGNAGRFYSPYGDLRMGSWYFTVRKAF